MGCISVVNFEACLWCELQLNLSFHILARSRKSSPQHFAKHGMRESFKFKTTLIGTFGKQLTVSSLYLQEVIFNKLKMRMIDEKIAKNSFH